MRVSKRSESPQTIHTPLWKAAINQAGDQAPQLRMHTGHIVSANHFYMDCSAAEVHEEHRPATLELR